MVAYGLFMCVYMTGKTVRFLREDMENGRVCHSGDLSALVSSRGDCISLSNYGHHQHVVCHWFSRNTALNADP